jgi:hypothetical protein
VILVAVVTIAEFKVTQELDLLLIDFIKKYEIEEKKLESVHELNSDPVFLGD